MKKSSLTQISKKIPNTLYLRFLYGANSGIKHLRQLFGRILLTAGIKRHRDIEEELSDEVVGLYDSTSNQSNPEIIRQALVKVHPNEKIRLVFLVITAEIWTSIEPVWETALVDDRFSCSIVVLKSEKTNVALNSFLKAKSCLESRGISYYTESNFSIEEFQPHVIFYPLPYAELYPKAFNPNVVVAIGCRIAYIPYGLEVGGGVFNMRYQFDTEIPRAAWKIFARSAVQHRNFGRYCSYGNGHVVLTGHPRYESTINQQLIKTKSQLEKANGRSVILWTPHFTVSTRRKWSSFLDHHELIIGLIDKKPDLFLLIRPHPFFRENLEKLDGWGPSRVSSWFKSVSNKDNMQIDNNIDYQKAFAVSSALMTDAGSFLTEYLLTGKPICYLKGQDDIGLSDEARELDCFYPGETESDIAFFLDQVVSHGADTKQEGRRNAINSYFYQGDEKASKLILDVISKDIYDPPVRKYSTQSQATKDHIDSLKYWLNAKTTYLAPESYYQNQEELLRTILCKYAKGRYAVDIGCGDGRFTQIVSEHFSYTEAIDPSKILIEKAFENATKAGISNINYAVDNLENSSTLTTYDFVSCMGVTSGFIDDEVFIRSIWKLKAAIKPNGLLLTKDSLSLSNPQEIYWNGYKAIYRNAQAYVLAFESIGLKLVRQYPIIEDTQNNRINSFFLFERREKSPC